MKQLTNTILSQPRFKKKVPYNSLLGLMLQENNMLIKVGLTHSMPLSVDTKADLKKIKKEMEKL